MKNRFQALINRLKGSSFYETFTDISTYFSAQVAIQALGVISLPVFTYFMDEEGYGIIKVYLSYATVFAIIFGANLFGAVSRYYYEEKEDFKTFMGTTLIASLTMFTISAVFVFTFRATISEWINLPIEVIGWLFGSAFFIALFSVFQQLYVAQKKSKPFSITQVVLQYSKFIGAVIGMYLMTEQTYLGKIQGELIAMSLIGIYLIYKIAPYVKFYFSIAHLKYIVQYSIPLIPFIVSGFILHSFDQWFINARLGHADAGLYGFAYTLGVLLAGFITSLLSGSNPDYFKWMKEEAYDRVNEQVVSLVKLLALATAFLTLFAIDLGTILSSKEGFLDALPIVPIIVAGYFFFGIAQFYNRSIYFIKKNIYLVFIVFTAGIINILLNSYYVPIYGYQAAAYTTLASYFVMAVLSWMTTVYILKMPALPLKRILVFIGYLGCLLAVYFLYFTEMEMSIGAILQKGILFLIFAAVIYFHNLKTILSSTEKE